MRNLAFQLKGVAARRYALWRASTLGRITEQLETRLIFDLAGNLAGKRVLDIGTGDGTYALEAAAQGAKVTGLDPDPEMLSAAERRAEGRQLQIGFQLGRVEAIPLADASFDVVFAVTVMCFVSDTGAALREMSRVLVPGGLLVLGELGRFSLWAAERRMRGWFGSDTWRHARFWSRRDLIGLVNRAGLRVAGTRDCVFYPPAGVAARILAPFDPILSRLHAPGAAFLALSASKPKDPV